MIFLLIILTACSNEVIDEIVFVDDVEYDYDLNFDYCSLVDTVNGYKVKAFQMYDNEINITEIGTVECNTTRVKGSVGTQEIVFRFNDVEYTKTVDFVKTRKPYFEKVELVHKIDRSKGSELTSFTDFINSIKGYDYKGNEINVIVDNEIDITVLGEQKIKLYIEDGEHKEELLLLVKLEDTDVPVIKPPTEPVAPPSNNNGGSAVKPPTEPVAPPSNNNGGSAVKPPTSNKTDKVFSINDYDSFEDIVTACSLYIQGANGNCSPIYDNDGIAIGYKASIK